MNNTNYKSIFLYFVLFFCTNFLWSQSLNDTVLKKIVANQDLIVTDSEKGYKELKGLLNEAIKSENHEYELRLLANKCRYFQIKQDVNNLITSSDYLNSKSKEYNNILFQSISRRYMSNAYSMNGLNQKAINELNHSIDLLNRINFTPESVINAKINVYSELANIYENIKKPRISVQKIKMAIREIESLKDGNKKDDLLYMSYSNLAAHFVEFDIDSSEFYIRKALLFKKDTSKLIFEFNNNYILGIIYSQRKDYCLAVKHLLQAESISNMVGNRINLVGVLKKLIEVYSATDSIQKKDYYKNKLTALELELTKNTNESLHKIIEKEQTENKDIIYKSQKNIYFFVISLLAVIIILLWIFVNYKKKQKFIYENKSNDTLDIVKLEDRNAAVQDIIEMIKEKQGSFMHKFNEVYPDFSKKLQEINPVLIQSEIEFCALLKLNLSTHEIAQYTSIQKKTVHNKKYRIRKKLNVPNNMDIYSWFNSI